MSDKPTWTTERRKLGDLREWDRNPRELSEHDAKHLARSIEKFNLADPLVINQDGQIVGGHQRKRVMLATGYTAADLVDVRVPSRPLTEREAEELNIRLNRNSGAWDFDILADQFEIDDLKDWGFKPYELGIAGETDVNEMWQGMPEFEQEDQLGIKTLFVHFSSQEHIEEFAQLVDQKITQKTKYIWYPRQDTQDTASSYSDEP